METRDAWLILNAANLRPRHQLAWLTALGGPCEILAAEDSTLLQVDGVTAVHVSRLRQSQAETDLVALHDLMARHELSIVGWGSPSYPPLLREACDPPAMLFIQGAFDERDALAIAVVGTRKCTPYGLQVTRSIVVELARRGFTVVSGLALGIDAEAHRAAVDTGGRTIAVLPCGPDITYPAAHRQLRSDVASNGAVVTEYAFGVPPRREIILPRNRIIAGLTLGTLVVEAPDRSGALVTARQAAECGRDVLAVPGDVRSPYSRGCHALIKDGAILVETVADIVDGLGIRLAAVPERPRRDTSDLPASERAILSALCHEPTHVDDIVVATGLNPSEVTSALMLLEVKSLVRRFPGSTYVRTD